MLLTLESKSKPEDEKDDLSFQYIGSEIPMDYTSTQESTNGKHIIKALSRGTEGEGQEVLSMEAKYQNHSPKMCPITTDILNERDQR